MQGTACKCGKPAVVGIGEPTEWVCMECFNLRLQKVRQQARYLSQYAMACAPQARRTT